MDGADFQAQYEKAKNILVNGEDTDDWNVTLILNNQSGEDIQSTGEIRLYVENHIGMNTYLPGAFDAAGPLYTFNVGESSYSTNVLVNGDNVPPSDEFVGLPITEVRFYDYRHYNNIDAGFSATLDISDPRCDSVLRDGATYVIKIEKL
jgi:hypothetical protein